MAYTFDKIMKKAELITLVCSLVVIGLVVGYLKFSSRLARAEDEARKANELIAELIRAESQLMRRERTTGHMLFSFVSNLLSIAPVGAL